MIEFIQKYWIQTIFSGMLAIFGFGYKKVIKKVKKFEYLGDGVKALLYDRLRQSYNYHMKNKYITIEDFGAFNDLYNSYHFLGGNGEGTEMLERLKRLPPMKPQDKDFDE